MKKSVGIIIQARMGSTRLPDKILMKLYEEDTVLDITIKRMKLCKMADKIVIAIPYGDENSPIIDAAKSHDIPCFIGDEDNVLERYYGAAKENNIDIIVRITSDCPFTDPKVVDGEIEFFLKNKYDYINSFDKNTDFPMGFSIEILSFDTLEQLYTTYAKTDMEKEHVTYYIKAHNKPFSRHSYNIRNIKKYRNLRVTIDEKEDLIMCRKIYKEIMKEGYSIDFSLFDIFKVIEENPELNEIYKHLPSRESYFPPDTELE